MANDVAALAGKVVSCRSCGVSTLVRSWRNACPACGANLALGIPWPNPDQPTGDLGDPHSTTAAILSVWSSRFQSLESIVFADGFGAATSRKTAGDILRRLKSDLEAEVATLRKFEDFLHPVMAGSYAPAIQKVHGNLNVRVNSRDREEWRSSVYTAVGEFSYHLSLLETR